MVEWRSKVKYGPNNVARGTTRDKTMRGWWRTNQKNFSSTDRMPEEMDLHQGTTSGPLKSDSDHTETSSQKGLQTPYRRGWTTHTRGRRDRSTPRERGVVCHDKGRSDPNTTTEGTGPETTTPKVERCESRVAYGKVVLRITTPDVHT